MRATRQSYSFLTSTTRAGVEKREQKSHTDINHHPLNFTLSHTLAHCIGTQPSKLSEALQFKCTLVHTAESRRVNICIKFNQLFQVGAKSKPVLVRLFFFFLSQFDLLCTKADLTTALLVSTVGRVTEKRFSSTPLQSTG